MPSKNSHKKYKSLRNIVKPAAENKGDIVIYQTDNGINKIDVKLENDTVWLTQAKIAELFGVERSVITKHLKNVYEEGELNKEATCAKIAQVQIEGTRKVTRPVEFYNLDVIL